MSDTLSDDSGVLSEGFRAKGDAIAVRRYDLDWLRVFAVLLLIYFHAAAVFYVGDLGEFYIQDRHPSCGMIYFIQFVHQWHMPLFFLLSGAGAWFALQTRTGTQFAAERFKRLFIPFLFGTLVLIPPQVYYHHLNTLSYHNSYIQFYPQFFNGIRPNGNFEWGHLWFLIYLFTFSLVALPLFLYLKRHPLLHASLDNWFKQPITILGFALPLMLIEGALRPHWSGFQNLYDDWANVSLYLLYFIYGYIICLSQELGQTISQYFKVALVIAIASMAVFLSLWVMDAVPERSYSLKYILYQLFRGFNSWIWVIALLGLGQHYLNVKNSILSYLNEASYPIYLLHQTILVAIAFYVVQLPVGVAEKFILIGTTSLIATLAVYEVLVRRINVLRFLFGLKL